MNTGGSSAAVGSAIGMPVSHWSSRAMSMTFSRKNGAPAGAMSPAASQSNNSEIRSASTWNVSIVMVRRTPTYDSSSRWMISGSWSSAVGMYAIQPQPTDTHPPALSAEELAHPRCTDREQQRRQPRPSVTADQQVVQQREERALRGLQLR